MSTASGNDARPDRRTVAPNVAPWGSSMHYSRAVRTGQIIEVSGTTAVNADGTTAFPGDIAGQARICLKIIGTALEELGSCLEDIVRTRLFVTEVENWKLVGATHDEVLGHVAPASSLVGVASLLHPDLLIEIEATAVVGSAIASPRNPAPNRPSRGNQ